jgi:nucleoside-diphosphate kinase
LEAYGNGNTKGLDKDGAFGTRLLAAFEDKLKALNLPNGVSDIVMGEVGKNTVQQTFIIIKPDGHAHEGEILKQLTEGTGLEIVSKAEVEATEELLREHYKHIAGKDFFKDVVKYMMGGYHDRVGKPLHIYILQGRNAIAQVRGILGATNPTIAAPGTIRGKYGKVDANGNQFNSVHASDKPSAVIRESELWGIKNWIVEKYNQDKVHVIIDNKGKVGTLYINKKLRDPQITVPKIVKFLANKGDIVNLNIPLKHAVYGKIVEDLVKDGSPISEEIKVMVAKINEKEGNVAWDQIKEEKARISEKILNGMKEVIKRYGKTEGMGSSLTLEQAIQVMDVINDPLLVFGKGLADTKVYDSYNLVLNISRMVNGKKEYAVFVIGKNPSGKFIGKTMYFDKIHLEQFGKRYKDEEKGLYYSKELLYVKNSNYDFLKDFIRDSSPEDLKLSFDIPEWLRSKPQAYVEKWLWEQQEILDIPKKLRIKKIKDVKNLKALIAEEHKRYVSGLLKMFKPKTKKDFKKWSEEQNKK